MLFVLSPAKSLDTTSPIDAALPASQPALLDRAAHLMAQLRTRSASELGTLMDISPKLAELNAERNRCWSASHSANNARQAALSFNGDVYEGLQAPSLTHQDWDWAQQHLLILSGLYGALRPLDWLQPYRLEMGTRLPVPAFGQSSGASGTHPNLYHYWAAPLAAYLGERLRADKTPVLVNLASSEYFKAVDTRALPARVIECVFQDEKAGQYKIISFLAKRARGLMARYAITERIDHPDALRHFDLEGYRFAPEHSSGDKLVFRRRQADRPTP